MVSSVRGTFVEGVGRLHGRLRWDIIGVDAAVHAGGIASDDGEGRYILGSHLVEGFESWVRGHGRLTRVTTEPAPTVDDLPIDKPGLRKEYVSQSRQ